MGHLQCLLIADAVTTAVAVAVALVLLFGLVVGIEGVIRVGRVVFPGRVRYQLALHRCG